MPPRFEGATGFGRAKSVIMLFLQGGPSHIDIWDLKPDAPSNIRGEFSPIKTKVPGIWLSETMPKLAESVDKCTLIRSMSYTPKGLFNHTAAIYQMLTSYPPDKVSPSGQLEPPSPIDFPTAGSWISKKKPPTEAVLPFVEMPRPLQESSVIGKGGAARFIGKAFDPYRLYQDPNKAIKLDDLAPRQETPPERLQESFELLKGINKSMPEAGLGTIAMKTNAMGPILDNKIATIPECLRFAMAQGPDTICSGVETVKQLEQNVAVIKHQQPFDNEELTQLLTRTGKGKIGPQVESYKKKRA